MRFSVMNSCARSAPSRALHHLVRLQRVERLVQVLRQHADACGASVPSAPARRGSSLCGSPGSSLRSTPSRPAARIAARREIRIARAVRQAQLEAAVRNAHAGRAVVVAVGDERRRPGRAGQRAAHDQPLVRIDRRRADRGQRRARARAAAEELIAHLRQPEPALVVLVVNRFFVLSLPIEMWKCAPVPVRLENGLGMNVRDHAELARDLASRHLEEA